MSQIISQENGLPKYFFSIGSEGTTQSGAMLSVRVGNDFASFYRGEIDEKALETTLANTVADLRSSYIAKGFSEEEFIPQLLEDLYEISRLYNIRGAGEASWYEGRALSAEQYGSTKHLDNFIYYNSDYYYRSEEMKGSLEEPEAFFDSVLQIWYGNWSFTGRVPVRQKPYQFPISVNMFDVVSSGGNTNFK